MADDAPPWLEVMRAISGLTEYSNGSNPKIEGMAAYIGRKFPEQADYAALYTDDSIAWCGVTAAFCMAAATADGISGPFGATDTDRWMWALSWADDPTYRHLSGPVLGCLVAMEREGGGHITMFEGWDGSSIRCRGGNQSDAVNVQSYDPSTVVAYVWPQSVPVPPTPPADRQELEEGDSGPAVEGVQVTLGVYPEDGDFGSITDSAVKGYQAACSITQDGVVGPMTWEKLDQLDSRVLSGDVALSADQINAITVIAKHSSIAGYQWRDRGQAPIGYIVGMACSFAEALLRMNSEDDAVLEMARAATGDDPDTDIFDWYADEFENEGMDNSEDADPEDRLRHLYAFMIGLGMRESSGRYSEGRDQSASNVSSDTAEAGLFQTSWNIRSCNNAISPLLTEYWANPVGFRELFREGVTLKSSDLGNFGSGPGAQYQFLSKYAPVFHVFVTAIGLRNLRQHWGPCNRMEVELRSAADAMLSQVQDLIEGGVEPAPEPPEHEHQVDIIAQNVDEVVITGDVYVTVNGKPWEP